MISVSKPNRTASESQCISCYSIPAIVTVNIIAKGPEHRANGLRHTFDLCDACRNEMVYMLTKEMENL